MMREPTPVIPAQAGIQKSMAKVLMRSYNNPLFFQRIDKERIAGTPKYRGSLDSGLRRNDEVGIVDTLNHFSDVSR